MPLTVEANSVIHEIGHAIGKKEPSGSGSTKPSINVTSGGAGTKLTTLPTSATTKKGGWDDTDIVHLAVPTR